MDNTAVDEQNNNTIEKVIDEKRNEIELPDTKRKVYTI